MTDVGKDAGHTTVACVKCIILFIITAEVKSHTLERWTHIGWRPKIVVHNAIPQSGDIASFGKQILTPIIRNI